VSALRRRPSPALLPALLLLAACASAPPASPPVLDGEIPEAWQAAGDEATAAALPAGQPWWTAFDDPELTALIDEALAHNHDLRAAAARVEAAAAQARIAGAALKPQLDGRVDASRRQQVFVGLPIPGTGNVLSSRSSSVGLSLNVSWEADLWGRLKAGRAAAASDLQAAAADLEGARLSLAAQTAKAYFALAEATRQVELAEATAASRRAATERAERRYRRGLLPALDVRLARASEAQAASALALRRRQREGIERQLEVLLGRYPSGDLDRPGGALPALPGAVPAGLPAALVTRRPDLAAAERRMAAAGWRVAEARRALYPRLSLTAGGGTTSDDVRDLLDEDFSVWNVAGNLLRPIFQGGRLRAAVELAEAGRERRLAEYAAAALRAFAEVETALENERRLAAEEAALEKLVEESRGALRLAEERYFAGAAGGGYLAILDSQRQLFAAESQLLAARRQRLDNRVDLYVALGGGFTTRSDDAAGDPGDLDDQADGRPSHHGGPAEARP